MATAWPASWNAYRFQDATLISDVNSDQTPTSLDLASGACTNCAGNQSSVQYAADGSTAFFRMRLATNIADASKGGLVGGAFLTQIAVAGVVKAVVGVDGKSSSSDSVYVANSVGGLVTTVYTYPFDSTGGQSSAGMRVVPAGDGTGQYFLDYQVPLSLITTVSGGAITSSTPIKLFYGSSAAANLATINKDFMTGSAVSFTNLATVSFSAAALAVSSSQTSLSGPNPPRAKSPSRYTVTVTAQNTGGGDLSDASVTIPAAPGVTLTSPTTAAGSLSGSPLVWSIATLRSGASVTASFTAELTPAVGDAGSNLPLIGVQSGTATDVALNATRTATSPAITVGPVAEAESFLVAFDSNGGSAVADQSVADGSLLVKPEDPTRTGYVFSGWFSASTGGDLWDFATDTVTVAQTLHAQWVSLTVASTTTTSVRANTATTLAGLSVTPADPEADLQVTVSTDVGTLSMTDTEGLTLAYGNNWSGDQSISFSGVGVLANFGLGSAQLTTGGDGGKTAHVSISAMPSQPGFIYSPSNRHFYEFVVDMHVSWTAARTAAANRSFSGQSGYLATMPNARVNDLVSNRIEGASNVWFGAKSTDTFGSANAIKRTWAWSDGPLAGRPISYCSNVELNCDFVNNEGLFSSWNMGEPNNGGVQYDAGEPVPYSGEYTAVTNWSGNNGQWNDLPPGNFWPTGYVVEYGDQAVGSTGFDGVVTDTSAVAIVDVPSIPTDVVAVPGDGSATVSFSPSSGQGSAVTGYTVTSTPAGEVLGTCTTSPCTVTGLTNGTPYTFTVHATNEYGDSGESEPSEAVVPATVPGAPTAVEAVRGDHSATVSFAAPDDGGAQISGYTVTSQPGNLTGTCSVSPCQVTGLTNGTSYTFTVHATNIVGDSVESAPSTAVIPAGKPAAPTDVTAVRGDTTASIAFTAPADNGSAITGYTVTAQPGGDTTECVLANPCLITGLTNGEPYTFTVHATNSEGDSPESDPSTAVVPATKPGVPTAVSAVRGDTTATVSFTAPASNGSPITGYTVTSMPGSQQATCQTSPCTVIGLTNGTAYTFTVHATNDVGDSAESAPSVAVTPASVPDAPTAVTAVRHNLSAEVAFTAPADGGSTITGYTVTSTPGGRHTECTGSPCLVEGLVNGTLYTFTVHATNAVGDSEESAPSAAVTPATNPGAPLDVTATRGDKSATVSFTAPPSNGSPITLYTVTSAPGGRTATCESSPCVVTGLVAGTRYTFTVIATNGVGDSDASDASLSMVATTTPDAPTAVIAVAGDQSAKVTFTEPASDGFSAITGYTVTSHPGDVLHPCASSPCVITGLTNGTAYTFTVRATNALGNSSESEPSDEATPMTVPDAPTEVAAIRGDGQATVTFKAPAADGGSAITGYVVTSHPGSKTATCETSPCTVTGLTNGLTYTFTVHAENKNGPSVESTPSEAVTPATKPAAPTAVHAARGDTSATVTFTPANDGGSSLTGYLITSYPDTGSHACADSPCVVTGLTNGTAYTFTVRATNALGASAESEPSAAVTPATVPGAPTDVVGTGSDGSVSVAFSAPTQDGGSPIISYLVTSVPDELTARCPTSPCVVEGLTNGTRYAFTVRAINDVGRSRESALSAMVTPATVPGEPLDLRVTRGPSSATLTFGTPDDNGGADITNYQVSTDDGDTWTTLDTSGTGPISATVRGLTNGTAYRFLVRAVNRVGAGPAASTDAVTPAARPDAPTAVTATIGDHRATVAWTAPDDNGAPITGYTVSIFPGGRTQTCSSSPCVITGLDNGTAYRFSVVATNNVGDSRASDRSTSVTPAGTPGAPTLRTVTSLAGAVSLEFDAPTTTGGSPVTGYEISTDGGAHWAPLTVTDSTPVHGLLIGLTNGTTYNVKVRAVNAVGAGTASAGLAVKPATTPSAPRNVKVAADRTRVTVSWTTPVTTGGSPITGYVVTANPGRQTCTTTTTSCVFPALPIGTYTFSVAATNTAAHLTGTGTGPAATSAATRVTARPGVPRNLTVTPGDRTLTWTFLPPASDGGSRVTGYLYTLDAGKTWHHLATTGTTTLKARLAPVLNGQTFAVAVRAANANGWSPATPLVNVRTAAWFRDPLTPAQRKAEVPVPKDPTAYKGPLRNTTAAYRSHNGTLAYPASGLRGRQLQPGQAVNVLFGFDSSTLTVAGKAELKAAATSLTYVTALTCEGYADYAGSAAHELALSKTRATAVCAALHSYAPQLTTHGVIAYGRTFPVIVGGTATQRGGNRRVVVVVQH